MPFEPIENFGCSESDPGAGEINHRYAVLDLLLPPDEDSLEPIEPRACAFNDHPRARYPPYASFRSGLFAAAPDPGCATFPGLRKSQKATLTKGRGIGNLLSRQRQGHSTMQIAELHPRYIVASPLPQRASLGQCSTYPTGCKSGTAMS